MESEFLVMEESSDNLEDVKKLIASKVPEDYEIVKQEVLSEGKIERITRTARTQAEAQEKALAILPADASEVQIMLTPEQVVNEQVEAFRKAGVNIHSRQLGLPGAELLKVTRLKPGRMQFLMIDALPGVYNLKIKLPATCVVTYKSKARVRIKARPRSRFRILQILNSSDSDDEKKHQIRMLLEDRKIVDKIGQLTHPHGGGGISTLLWCECGYPKIPSLLDIQSSKSFDNYATSIRFTCPQCHNFALEENYE